LHVPNAPSERGGTQIVATNKALYVMFGFSGQELGDVHHYDLTQEQWTKLPLLGTAPAPRSVVYLSFFVVVVFLILISLLSIALVP